MLTLKQIFIPRKTKAQKKHQNRFSGERISFHALTKSMGGSRIFSRGGGGFSKKF